MSEHLVSRFVDGATPGCDLFVGLPLSRQPFRREEPRLVEVSASNWRDLAKGGKDRAR